MIKSVSTKGFPDGRAIMPDLMNQCRDHERHPEEAGCNQLNRSPAGRPNKELTKTRVENLTTSFLAACAPSPLVIIRAPVARMTDVMKERTISALPGPFLAQLSVRDFSCDDISPTL